MNNNDINSSAARYAFWATAPAGFVKAGVLVEEDGVRNQGRRGVTTGYAKTPRSGMMQVQVRIVGVDGGLRWISYFRIVADA